MFLVNAIFVDPMLRQEMLVVEAFRGKSRLGHALFITVVSLLLRIYFVLSLKKPILCMTGALINSPSTQMLRMTLLVTKYF